MSHPKVTREQVGNGVHDLIQSDGLAIVNFVVRRRLGLLVGGGDVIPYIVRRQDVKMVYSNLYVFSNMISDATRES